MADKEKYVDESWKEEASQEKDKLTSSAKAGQPEDTADHEHKEHAVEVNFLNYVTSLGFQAMIFMGEIPNPVSNKTEKNLDQSKFLIDTLVMLKDKTEGNLNDQEKQFLENTIYELQLRFVQVSQGGNIPEGGENK